MALDDYGSIIQSGINLVPDLNKSLLEQAQTAALGAQARETQVAAAANAQKINRLQQFQQDIQTYDGSPASATKLIMKYPEYADHLKQGWDVQDIASKTADLTQTGEIYSAASSGNWALAKKLAHDRADAERAAGKTDPAYDEALNVLDQAADGDPTQQKVVLNMLGTHLAAIVGPEHFSTVYGALKGGYTLDAGAARYDDAGNLVAHSPFIKDADGNIRLWTDTNTPPPARGEHAPATGGGFDNAIATVLGNEGGYNPKDMNGAPVNFGINAKANAAELAKLGVSNIKDLTKDQAIQIYKDKYWNGSGAENLPANLQTPYFDVYIRNEKIAKQALAASGGDPAKFMQLSNAYFQNLAAKTGTQSTYGKAWAARDANNLAIATGQASPETAAPAAAATAEATSRFPIVIPGSSSPDQFHTLTDAQVKARGLDPSQQYQLNTKTGQVTGLGQKTGGTDLLQQYGIAPNETGPSVLAKLPANVSAQVKALAEGRLGTISSFALAKPYWQTMLQLATQYDPSFDMNMAPVRKAAIQAFTGTGKGAMLVGSANRVANHMDLLENESKKLAGPETGFGPLNTALATAGQAFEPADAKAYDTEVTFVAGELGKLAKAGVVTEGETDKIIGNLSRKNSSATRQAAIQAAVGIIAGAIGPLKDQYNSAFTNDSTRPKIPWVSPKAQEIYKRIAGVDMSLSGDDNATGAVKTRQPPVGATKTATGPNGEKAALVNGHWVRY